MSTVARFPQPAEPHVEYRLECAGCNQSMVYETENGARDRAIAHNRVFGHRMRLVEVSEKELRLEK